MDGYLLWEVPEGTLSILLSRSLLARLKDHVEQVLGDAFAETGAVLLGRSDLLIESGRRVITIEDFDRGVSRLRDSAVVGFMQCRKQKTLHLEETDFRLLKACPDLVCLMVRPDTEHGAVGGFFYREDRTVKVPGTAMQFPISPDALDCKGLLCMGSETQSELGEQRRHSKRRRLLFATAGLALILCPLVIWLTTSF